jgi:hypothetical protein
MRTIATPLLPGFELSLGQLLKVADGWAHQYMGEGRHRT